ncbi:MAG: alpha/beta fold hydrolase [Syntrophomonadaceae bacterium]|nr:alpha/beta fold hydrolase [Syntrophomonadaceae bacterium]
MQDVIIANKHNEQLSAYLWAPPARAKYMMVICHGFRGAKENGGKIVAFAEKLQKLNLGVLAFDFSGSGNSEGDFLNITLTRQADDLRQVVDDLSDKYSLPIILLGRSFGGSTVLAGGAGDKRVAGYILWSTPIFMHQTFAAMLPEEYKLLQEGHITRIRDEAGEYFLHPDLIRDFDRHDMDAYLHQIRLIPTLVVHATDDEVVDLANARHINDLLPNCSLFTMDQAGHRFLEKIEAREAITLEWLKSKFGL